MLVVSPSPSTYRHRKRLHEEIQTEITKGGNTEIKVNEKVEVRHLLRNLFMQLTVHLSNLFKHYFIH